MCPRLPRAMAITTASRKVRKAPATASQRRRMDFLWPRTRVVGHHASNDAEKVSMFLADWQAPARVNCAVQGERPR